MATTFNNHQSSRSKDREKEKKKKVLWCLWVKWRVERTCCWFSFILSSISVRTALVVHPSTQHYGRCHHTINMFTAIRLTESHRGKIITTISCNVSLTLQYQLKIVWSVNPIYSFIKGLFWWTCILGQAHNDDMECKDCVRAVAGFISRQHSPHVQMVMMCQ